MRKVRISSVNFHRSEGAEGLRQAKELMGTALLQDPDLILLPECFANSIDTAEDLDGPIIQTMSDTAKENGCYVVAPLYRSEGGLIYNSSVLIDRSGGVCGIYDKYFPTDYEIAAGTTPGTSAQAFETDFGKVGLAICFDLNFHEVAQGYAESGAEIILWSSAYEGGRQLCQWALEHSVFVVSAYWGGTCYFVDKTGHVLESSDSWRHPVATREINLDSYVFHPDYNFHSVNAILKEYGPRIHIRADVPEGRMTLESLSDDVDVAGIKEAYGLETFREYLDRTRRIRIQALSDRSGIKAHMREGEV